MDYNFERSSEAGFYVKAICGKRVPVSHVRFLSLKQLNFFERKLFCCVAHGEKLALFSRLVTKSLISNCAPNKRTCLQVACSRLSVRRERKRDYAGLKKRERNRTTRGFKCLQAVHCLPTVFRLLLARAAIFRSP